MSNQSKIERAWFDLDWIIRTQTVAFLELCPSLQEHAKELSELPEITSPDTLPLPSLSLHRAMKASAVVMRVITGHMQPDQDMETMEKAQCISRILCAGVATTAQTAFRSVAQNYPIRISVTRETTSLPASIITSDEASLAIYNGQIIGGNIGMVAVWDMVKDPERAPDAYQEIIQPVMDKLQDNYHALCVRHESREQ